MACLYEKVSYSANPRMGFSALEELSETCFGADALNIYIRQKEQVVQTLSTFANDNYKMLDRV